MDIDIGITKAHRESIAKGLSQVLADTYVLYLKTHAYHWNVTGPLFRPLHAQLDELADDARMWADEVAERLVAIGVPSDGRIETVAAQTPLSAFPDGFVEDSKVVVAIVTRLDEIIGRIRSRVDHLAVADPVTQDMVIVIATGLDKHRWMFAAQQH